MGAQEKKRGKPRPSIKRMKETPLKERAKEDPKFPKKGKKNE